MTQQQQYLVSWQLVICVLLLLLKRHFCHLLSNQLSLTTTGVLVWKYNAVQYIVQICSAALPVHVRSVMLIDEFRFQLFHHVMLQVPAGPQLICNNESARFASRQAQSKVTVIYAACRAWSVRSSAVLAGAGHRISLVLELAG